jgi:hypothetical protein
MMKGDLMEELCKNSDLLTSQKRKSVKANKARLDKPKKKLAKTGPKKKM